MRPIEINLAARPVQNNFLFYAGYAVALILIALFTTYNVRTLMEHSTRVAELNAGLAEGRALRSELEREGRRLLRDITSRDLVDLSNRIGAANEILAERKFSWTRMLNALEEVQPYKVRLLELRPVIVPQGVLIQARGIAKDLENFWQLQQALQDHPMFRRVYPASYSTQVPGDFLFSLSFNYFDDPSEAPGEGEEAAVTPETIQADGALPAVSPPVRRRAAAPPSEPDLEEEAGPAGSGESAEPAAVDEIGGEEAPAAAGAPEEVTRPDAVSERPAGRRGRRGKR
jgi:hypothetical protein